MMQEEGQRVSVTLISEGHTTGWYVLPSLIEIMRRWKLFSKPYRSGLRFI